MNHLTTWIAAAGAALLLAGFGPFLDNPPEAATSQADKREAQEQAKARARFEKAARKMCGHTGWSETPDGAVQCLLRGDKFVL